MAKKLESPSAGTVIAAYLRRTCSMDSRSLALFRIGVAAVVLLNLLLRIPDFNTFYTESGVLPLNALRESKGERSGWTLYALSPSQEWAWFLFVGTTMCSLALLCGVWARPTAILLWMLLVSLHHRNPWIQNSGDHLLLFLVLWGIFLPWQRHWSVSMKGRVAAAPVSVFGPATLALVLQFVFLYSFGALHKSGAEWRETYVAVSQTLELQAFVTPLGEWMLGFPALCRLLTMLVLWTELLLPLLLFVPWRNGWWRLLAVGFSFGLHIGLASCMVLGLFPLVSIVLALPLLPTSFWSFLSRFKRQQPSTNANDLQQLPLWKPGQMVCGVLLAYVSMSNLQTLPTLPIRPGDVVYVIPSSWQPAWNSADAAVRSMSYKLSIYQKWHMFSPQPYMFDEWNILRAELNDGSAVDLWPLLSRSIESSEVPVQRRDAPIAGFPSQKWRKFISHLQNHSVLSSGLADYLVRTWDGGQPEIRQVRRLEIVLRYRNVAEGQSRAEDQEVVLFVWQR